MPFLSQYPFYSVFTFAKIKTSSRIGIIFFKSPNGFYQLDWSIGESVTTTHIGGSYTLSQGFHQGSYVITAIDDAHPEVEMSVYPNPTSNFIIVELQANKVAGNLMVTNVKGKVLLSKKITSDTNQLDFSNYAHGVYFLTVKQDNTQLIKSFKIIKK